MKKYILWQDMMLFYGSLPKSIHLHQHPVIQLVIGIDAPFLKKDENNLWQPHQALLIAPNVAHECNAANKRVFSLNIEPESRIGEHIMRSFKKDEIFKNLNDDELSYFDFDKIDQMIKDEELEKLYQLISKFFYIKNPTTPALLSQDERVIKIRKYIQENIHQKFETNELCQLVFLSESRLLHLFKENVGIPIRNYILWMRIKTAIELIVSGKNLTYAAHEAGFSDSSHFSKTFVNTIGLNPAELLKNSKFIQVCELAEV